MLEHTPTDALRRGRRPRTRRVFRCALLSAPRRGRRPRRPVFCSLVKGIFRAPVRGILLPTAAKGCKNAAKNQWFLDFLSPDYNRAAKRFRIESLVRLLSLPLPRTASRCAVLLALRREDTRPCKTRFVLPHIFISRGPLGRTCTCRRWRQVRDLIIA